MRDTNRKLLEKRGMRQLRFAEKDPKWKSSRMGKALIDAIRYQDAGLAVWLLQRGADPNTKERERRTALWWAATYSQLAVIRELVERGAKLPDDVLMGPVTKGDHETVRFLIRHGGNVNCVASEYNSIGRLQVKEALLWAALRTALPNSESIPIMLIRAGAKVNQLVHQSRYFHKPGHSMLGMAAHFGLLRTVRVMLLAGADIDLRDKHGRTALFDALEQGQVAVVKELLRAGADTKVKDATGMTPLDALRSKEESPNMEFEECLIGTGAADDSKKLEAERARWNRLRKRLIALLEQHERVDK
jgi:ankyrin repeat protein